MKNKVKIAKRLLSILLVFLFSINSFAAIVSDNDGSAFVTKAEFEALKKSFAEQIDNYNTSIDEKIDGAIASYLSGIKLSEKQEIQSYLYTINISPTDDVDSTFADLSTLEMKTNDYYGVEALWNVQATNAQENESMKYLWWNNVRCSGPSGIFQRGDNVNANRIDYGDHVYTNEGILRLNGTDYFYLKSPTVQNGQHRLILYTTYLRYAMGNMRPGSDSSTPWRIDLSDLTYPKQVSINFKHGTTDTFGYRGHLYTAEGGGTYYPKSQYNASSSINSYTVNTIDNANENKFDDPTAIENIIQNGSSRSGGPGVAWASNSTTTGLDTGNFRFKYIRQKRYQHNQTEWINLAASELLNKPIYKYAGIPVCNVLQPCRLFLDINFEKFVGAYDEPTQCSFMIANCPFENEAITSVPQYDETTRKGWLLNDTITLSSAITRYSKILTFDENFFNAISKSDGVTLYIKCVPDQGSIRVNSENNMFVCEISD